MGALLAPETKHWNKTVFYFSRRTSDTKQWNKSTRWNSRRNVSAAFISAFYFTVISIAIALNQKRKTFRTLRLSVNFFAKLLRWLTTRLTGDSTC